MLCFTSKRYYKVPNVLTKFINFNLINSYCRLLMLVLFVMRLDGFKYIRSRRTLAH